MCSEKMEKTRLRRATWAPPLFQKPVSSGRQSSSQCDRCAAPAGTGAAVVSMVVVMRLLREFVWRGTLGTADEKVVPRKEREGHISRTTAETGCEGGARR